MQEQVGGSPVDLATYRYLGSGRVVGITYPEPSEDIVHNLHGTSSGTYPSLDNFGRVTSCTWFKDHAAGDLEFYDSDITYDRLGQVNLVEDNVYTGRDAQYSLDGLSRSIKTEEGTWGGSSIGSLSRQQIWDLDSIGNWEADQLDLNGDNDFVDTSEVNVASTFNAANEQTARNIVGGASVSQTFDAVGNLTNDGTYRYTYDVWGRMVKLRTVGVNITLALHRYNGLGYRIGWQYDVDADFSVETTGSNDDPWLYFIYDGSWRAVASVFAVDNGSGTESGEYLAKSDDDPRELFVFHTAGVAGRGTASKLDDVILRDRDFNQTWGAAGDGTCEQRTYYAQNWRGDVVATLDSTGARRETIRYSTYGLPFGIASGDVDGSGSVVAGDASAVNAQIGKSYGQAGYTVLLDVDLDGDVDVNDYNIANGQSGLTLGHSVLSAAPTTADGGNRMGYAGYAWEPVSSKYAVRHRVFDPRRGRWSRRDPLGYVDSPTLYAYVNDRAMTALDPMGLAIASKPISPEGTGKYFVHEGNQVTCAPYSQLGADEAAANNPGCGLGGGGGLTKFCKTTRDCGPEYPVDLLKTRSFVSVAAVGLYCAENSPCFINYTTSTPTTKLCIYTTTCTDGTSLPPFEQWESGQPIPGEDTLKGKMKPTESGGCECCAVVPGLFKKLDCHPADWLRPVPKFVPGPSTTD